MGTVELQSLGQKSVNAILWNFCCCCCCFLFSLLTLPPHLSQQCLDNFALLKQSNWFKACASESHLKIKANVFVLLFSMERAHPACFLRTQFTLFEVAWVGFRSTRYFFFPFQTWTIECVHWRFWVCFHLYTGLYKTLAYFPSAHGVLKIFHWGKVFKYCAA